MSIFDFFFEWFEGEFNSAWSGPLFHELHPEQEDFSTGKIYKQPKRIFKWGEITDDPGIYLIRDPYKTTIYVGQTYAQGIRTRLSQHFRQTGSEALTTGIMYEIRWATTPGGQRIAQIAEALAILHFKPEGNIKEDWRGNLRRALDDNLSSQIIGEAKRLGFLTGSAKATENYLNRLLKAVSKKSRA